MCCVTSELCRVFLMTGCCGCHGQELDGLDSLTCGSWVASLKGHVAAITALDWTPGDKPYIMSTSMDRTLRLWRYGPPGEPTGAGEGL
jgi:hypothetical protein